MEVLIHTEFGGRKPRNCPDVKRPGDVNEMAPEWREQSNSTYGFLKNTCFKCVHRSLLCVQGKGHRDVPPRNRKEIVRHPSATMEIKMLHGSCIHCKKQDIGQ